MGNETKQGHSVQKERRARSMRWIPAALAAAVGILFSVWAFDVVRALEREQDETDFDRLAGNCATALQKSIDSHLLTLYTLSLYLGSSEDLTSLASRVSRRPTADPRQLPARLRVRNSSSDALGRFPGVHALEWIPRVLDSERTEFETVARENLSSDFEFKEPDTQGQVVRAATRPEYFPAFFARPVERQCLPLGFDLAADPMRWAAMDKARRTGSLRATPWMALDGAEGAVPACQVFFPIYGKVMSAETYARRGLNLLGFAAVVYRIDMLVESALHNLDVGGIYLFLSDAESPQEPHFVFAQGCSAASGGGEGSGLQEYPFEAGGNGSWATFLDFAGRRWLLRCHAAPLYLAAQRHWQAATVLAAGLLFSALLTAYLWIAFGRAARVQRLVAERTDALRQANERLGREVARRERTRTALKSSRERLRILFDYAPDAFWLTDLQGRLVDGNKAAEEALGYPKEKFIGKTLEELSLLSSDEIAKAAEMLAQSAQGKPTGPDEITLNRNDGRRIVGETRTFPVWVQGQTLILTISRDITERKQTEEERRRLEIGIQNAQKLESLGVMAGGIAHDFNNLLMGILGNAGLALRKLAPDSSARSNLEKIEQTSLRAAELTRQMLAYSGRSNLVTQLLNLSRLVQGVAKLLEASIPKKSALRYELAEDLPALDGDPDEIRQLVVTLVTNASEAIGERSGLITVRTGLMQANRAYLSESHLNDDLPEGAYVYLEVSDTGCGMDAETQARIFDPFFSTKFTGRGLGLAASLGIARAHRGAIRVSSAPGRGSSFRILFPAKDAPPQEGLQPPAPERPREVDEKWRGQGTILVADDEETVRSVASSMLQQLGFEVLTARDGLEAVELFRLNADRIDAVLLDLTMPRMDGEEALAQLREIRPDVRVVLSSGYSEQDAGGRFVGKGLAGFIHKPYRWSDLMAKMQEALAEKAPP